MRVLFLTRYGPLGASSRMRSFQFFPYLNESGIECVASPLFDNALLLKKYQRGSYAMGDVVAAYWRRFHALMDRENFDLVWIEKEALPWFPAWWEQLNLRGKPYALDFDDAIFHNYDLHRSAIIRRLYGKRVDRLMAGARLVVAGNSYLASRAKSAGACQVEVLPTVVDTQRYVAKSVYEINGKPRIVWIGSPSTVQYLERLSKPLSVLARRQSFALRIIGGNTLAIPGVDMEVVPWSVETEAKAVAECDVGVMPLRDTPWEYGKCAYKLIQYMACGLPTVASPVGANREVVIDDHTGFFADTTANWVDKLERLLGDTALRSRLGRAGRQRVEMEYSLAQVAPRLTKILLAAGTQ